MTSCRMAINNNRIMKTFGCLAFVLLFVGGLDARPSVKRSAAPSTSLLTFLSIFPGDFLATDYIFEKGQDGEEDKYLLAAFQIVPVSIPALNPKYLTYFYEEEINDVVEDRLVLAVYQADDGTIHAIQYKFTENVPRIKGNFNLEDFQNYTTDDFQTTPGCDVVFQQVSDTIFLGEWPECDHLKNGITPNFATAMTCDSVAIIYFGLPPWDEKALIPVTLKRVDKGENPLLLELPDGYVNPCKDHQNDDDDEDKNDDDDDDADEKKENRKRELVEDLENGNNEDNGDDQNGDNGDDQNEDNGDDQNGDNGDDQNEDNGDDQNGDNGDDRNEDNGDNENGENSDDQNDDNGDDKNGDNGDDQNDDNGDDQNEDNGDDQNEDNGDNQNDDNGDDQNEDNGDDQNSDNGDDKNDE